MSHSGLLRGIVPPMVTPMLDADTLDVVGLERLIEHIIPGGVAGLFILGTTGEGPLLSYRLRRELIERTCRCVAKRVPVLVGITDTAFTESLAIARHAADCGADLVVAAPPYYLPLGRPELQHYYERLAAALPLPLFLYNYPALTKTTIDLEIVRRAVLNPRIAGIKDSSGNMTYYQRLLEAAKARPDWTVLAGPDELLAQSVFAGGHGGVNGGANVFPKLYVECYRAAAAGQLQQARALQERILRVTAGLYTVGSHASAVTMGIKCALNIMGICAEAMAEPLQPFSAAERSRIESSVEELKSV